ncbi:transcription factor kayak isoform X1 [Drosophila virilis]|uniref:Uncharacterized protein, isoform A n=1 Tax=Drosophila virilis TaxID=7244 RepID=B4LQG0_DROVI|nr:inner centromere protein A isoform X1 [Drosophila virilis]EDW63410.1 uncharacterized protein Dvir_GJ13267, isoform A [Drosophila virilis]
MNSATKVGEIFTAAGQAFSRLGDLTMQLHPNAESPSGKWTDEEIDMLHSSIMRFSDDLSKISLSIKNRTVSQIRQALKKKAFEDAGIPAKQVPVQQVQHVIQTVQQLPIVQQHHVFKSHIIQQQPQPQQQTKQIILQPQTTTTTVTIKQFQQMQQQKAAALAAAQAAAAANAPTITENIIIQQPTSTTAVTVQQPQQQQQQPHAVVATSATQQIIVPAATTVLSPSAAVGAVVVADDVVSTTSTPTTATNAGLKCGPDVSMTLNRINVQENEVDVEECLPAEVVKLDFVSEEVAG